MRLIKVPEPRRCSYAHPCWYPGSLFTRNGGRRIHYTMLNAPALSDGRGSSHLLVTQREKLLSGVVRCGRATARRTTALVMSCFGRRGKAVCINSKLAQ